MLYDGMILLFVVLVKVYLKQMKNNNKLKYEHDIIITRNFSIDKYIIYQNIKTKY